MAENGIFLLAVGSNLFAGSYILVGKGAGGAHDDVVPGNQDCNTALAVFTAAAVVAS